MFGRKYPEKITSQITATICDTTLSNSIESHSEAPEEFTNPTSSQGTPLDFSYSSLNLENSRLDLTNSNLDLTNSSLDLTNSSLDLTESPSHKATSEAQMQTNLQSVRQSRSDFLCSPVVPGDVPGGVPGGANELPEFDRPVIPISTKEDRLCPTNNNGTPGFSDLPMALLCDNALGQPSSNTISSNSNDDPENKSTSITSLEINLEGKFQRVWCQNLCETLTQFDY